MSDDFEFLKVKTDGAVATVLLSRPPVNAAIHEMYLELRRAFSMLSEPERSLGAVILAGEGRHFCGGNDLTEFQSMTPANAWERMFYVREAFWAIRDCAVPVIAAVHGVALGTGLGLAASCDMVVAADDARFGLPEIKVGVMGGGRHLARLMPQSLVRLMFYSGEPLPAEEFQRFGGVISVVPKAELLHEANRVAQSIARHSPVALRFAKRAMNEIESMPVKEGYEYEQTLTSELSGYEDSKEGVAAFFEKREPRWSGR